jgi:hypothetical protein
VIIVIINLFLRINIQKFVIILIQTTVNSKKLGAGLRTEEGEGETAIFKRHAVNKN